MKVDLNNAFDLGVFVKSDKEAKDVVVKYISQKLGIDEETVAKYTDVGKIGITDGEAIYIVHKKTKSCKDVPIYVLFSWWMVQ